MLMFFEAFPNELNNDLQDVLKIIPQNTYNVVGYRKQCLCIGSIFNLIKNGTKRFILLIENNY